MSRKAPYIPQLTTTDCGAACLAMVLASFGKRVSLDAAREVLGSNRDGVTALMLVRAANHFGLETRAFCIEEPQHIPSKFPTILHWENNHFVVLEKWSPKKAIVVDPACGRRTLSAEEFTAGYSQTVLVMQPGNSFIPGDSTGSIWKRYLALSVSAPGLLTAVLGTSLCLQVLGLAVPAITAYLINQVIPNHSVHSFQIAFWGLLAFVLAQGLFSFSRQWLLISLQVKLDSKIMVEFFQHLLKLPFSFFQNRSAGDLVMRLNSNTVVRDIFSQEMRAVLLDGSLVLIYLVLMFCLNSTLASLVAGIGVVELALSLVSIRFLHPYIQRDVLAQAKTQSYVVEVIHGMETHKATGSEEQVFFQWQKLFANQLQASVFYQQLAAGVETLTEALRTASPLALLAFGSALVMQSRLSLGDMLGFAALGGAFLTPLAKLAQGIQSFQIVGTHLMRLNDVFETAPEQNASKTLKVQTLSGQIRLDQVSFRYSPQAPEVLKNISLEIQPGQMVAFVGPSGSGKSTLAKLLTALYRPTSGEVYFGELPLEHLEFRSLRRNLGVVLQEFSLFQGSIRSNLTLHNPEIPLSEVKRAARLAALDTLIESLPLGYETHLSELGSNFSGGQRQRLCLARALASNPPILILDEATSELDTQTEQIITKNLAQLNCTRIVIAHRLSTVREADLIVVLDQGEIVEQGTHEELLALDGLYARLAYDQSLFSQVFGVGSEICSETKTEKHLSITEPLRLNPSLKGVF